MDAQISEKQEMILAAAQRAFSKYGYRRTAMADIAEEADISRPALYLEFKNKEDIFRSLASLVYQQALATGVAAFQDLEEDPRAGLRAGVAARELFIFDILRGSPHGQELTAAGNQHSADIITTAEHRFSNFIAGALGQLFDSPREDRSERAIQEMATVLIRAAHGLKQHAEDRDQLQQQLVLLVDALVEKLLADC